MAKNKKTTITAIKGFNTDLQCRGYQYVIGETYQYNGEVSICSNGFHACTNPFDVWAYYGPYKSRFAIVEMTEPVVTHGSDTKIASGEITITAELSLSCFISKAVDYIINLCKSKDDSRYAQIGSSGYSARIGSSGYSAQIGSSGDSAQIGSSGDSAQIGSSGDYARIKSSGENAIVACAGLESVVIGKIGCAIAMPYRDDKQQTRFATAVIGEDGIKPDTPYCVNNGGEFIEVTD